MLKNSVDCVGSTLNQCVMDHKKLKFMFHKKHAPHIHAHHTRHTHASHVYSHDTMYAHVYTCTHCECKGHLAKFCYDRIHNSNFANKFVWVRKSTTPMDPIRYGYQNSPLLYLM